MLEIILYNLAFWTIWYEIARLPERMFDQIARLPEREFDYLINNYEIK